MRFLEYSGKTKYFLSKLIILTEKNWLSKWEHFKGPSCLCLKLKAFKSNHILKFFPWICDKSLDISGFILGKPVNLKLSETFLTSSHVEYTLSIMLIPDLEDRRDQRQILDGRNIFDFITCCFLNLNTLCTALILTQLRDSWTLSCFSASSLFLVDSWRL